MGCKSKMPSARTTAFVKPPTRNAWRGQYTRLPKDELWRLLVYADDCAHDSLEWAARREELYAYARENEVTLTPR